MAGRKGLPTADKKRCTGFSPGAGVGNHRRGRSETGGENLTDALLAAFHQVTGKAPTFLFFDEIQRLPGWSRVLRTLHNQNRYRIVVTGSNAGLLEREIATELRGRCRNILILPFSFPEFLRFHGIPHDERTLLTPARGRVLEAVMRYSLNAFSDLFSISMFEKELKRHHLPGSKQTISNYLGYLQEAFFLIAHEKFSYSPRRRMGTAPYSMAAGLRETAGRSGEMVAKSAKDYRST